MKKAHFFFINLLFLLLFSSCCILDSCKYNSITPSADRNYTEVKNEIDTNFKMVSSPYLNIKYIELYNNSSGNLNYKIFQNFTRQIVQSNTTAPVNISLGTNYIQIPLNGLDKNARYVLEITDLKNQKQYLSFYIK